MATLRHRLFLIVGVAILCTLVSLFVALRGLPSSTWTEGPDLPNFLILTSIYSPLVAVISFSTRSLLRSSGAVSRACIAFLSGAALGLLWTVAAIYLLWPYVREIGFPVIDSWQAGGIAGFLLMYFSARNRQAIAVSTEQPPNPRFMLASLQRAGILGVCFVFAVMVLYAAGLSVYWGLLVEKEIYLIPKGYEGPILIEFEQPDGSPGLYEGRNRIYVIPADGLLKIKIGFVKHVYEAEFWYVDEYGGKTRLQYQVGCSGTDPALVPEEVVVCSAWSPSKPPTRGFVVARPAKQKEHRQFFENLFTEHLINR